MAPGAPQAAIGTVPRLQASAHDADENGEHASKKPQTCLQTALVRSPRGLRQAVAFARVLIVAAQQKNTLYVATLLQFALQGLA